jgi:alanyl-tRNA synthetase
LTNSSIDEVVTKISNLQDEVEALRDQIARMRQEWVRAEFDQELGKISLVSGVPVLSVMLKGADVESLRLMTDVFRQKHPSGVVAIGSIINEKPIIICAVTEDLVKRGLNAGDLVREAAAIVGGSGGGKPALAQAGGRDPAKLPDALISILELVRSKLE